MDNFPNTCLLRSMEENKPGQATLFACLHVLQMELFVSWFANGTDKFHLNAESLISLYWLSSGYLQWFVNSPVDCCKTRRY